MQNQIPKNLPSRSRKAKEGWQKVKLGDVALLNPSVSIGNGRYPYIPMEDLDWNKKYVYEKEIKEFKGGTKFENGDVLFARITPCLENGKIGRAKNLTNGKGFGSTEYFIIRGKQGLTDTDYLYYLCRTYRLRQTAINSMVGASGRQRANIDSLQGYELDLPDFPEQQKIASILSAFDDKIEVNNKIAKTLEQMSQALFKESFVKNALSSWEVSKFENYARLEYGKALQEEKRIRGKVLVFGSSGQVGTHNEKLCSGPGIVVGRKGNVGSVFWIDDDFYPIDTTFYVNSKISLYYIYFVLKNTRFHTGDSAVPGLNRESVYSLKILVPDKQTLKNFESIVTRMFKKLVGIKKENQKLAALRDLLLPKLMKGEIRV